MLRILAVAVLAINDESPKKEIRCIEHIKKLKATR
jgi:hypothetical protein